MSDLKSALRARLVPTAAAFVTLGLGLELRALFTGWFAKYGGVALWATLVYWLVLWCIPRLKPGRVAGLTVLISFAVELFQLTPMPMALYEVHPFFALVFGTTFHLPDFPSYVVGAGLGFAIHRLIDRRSK
jgi:hypothetical protein